MREAARPKRYARPIQELALSPWLLVPLAIGLGAFFASQFFHITARYVKLIFGLTMLLALSRMSLATALCLFAFVFVAPTNIALGDTNMFLVGGLLVLWVTRMRLGLHPRPVRSPVDWAIGIYLLLHLVSFVNVESPNALRLGRDTMTFTLAGAALFFLLVNGLRDERQFETFLKALCVTALFVDITAIYEYFTGGKRLIPDWFLFTRGQSAPGGRIGGIFGSHGMLADFSAMLFYLQVVLAMRTTSRRAKFYYVGLAVLSLVMISLTVNRGGAVGWVLGGIVFLWCMRRRIRAARVIVALPVLLAILAVFQLLGHRNLLNLGIITRLSGTQFIRGIPETRVQAWTDIMARIPEHLWIGHGPYYDLQSSGAASTIYWPHSGYLFYLYTIGVLGLASWLWIMGKLIWKSRPRRSIDFARAPLGTAMLAVTHVQLIIFAAVQARSDHQRGNVYVYFMWIIFALSAVAWRLTKQPPPPAEEEKR